MSSSSPKPTAAGVQRTKERKERPVFRRSRAGCLTCKKRRKKCDEQFDGSGNCERCLMGGFVCEGGRAPETIPSASADPPSTATTPPSPSVLDPSAPVSATTTAVGFAAPATVQTCSAPNLLFNNAAPTAPAFDPAQSYPFNASFPAYSSAAAFDPFANLEYSGALLALFGAIPPSMPLADTSYANDRNEAHTLVVGRASKNVCHHLRTWVLKELGEEEARETGVPLPPADLESAVTLYANLDAEWLFGFKREERYLIQKHVFEVLRANATTRESCLAVASVLRYRLLPAEDLVTRERVLRQGEKFYNRAMAALHQDASFEVRLMGVLDCAMHAAERCGIAAAYSVVSLADAFIVNQARHPHPPPYIPSLNGPTNMMLRGYAYMDVIRSMSLDTRPLFDFTVSDPFPTFEILDNVRVNGAGELVRGVFPPILLFIARISNLSSDEKEGVRSAEEVRRLGEALEQEIIDWQPSPAAQLETEDSLEELEAFSTREMWRHAILIDLRQRLYHVGSLYPSIRSSLQQIITFGGGSPSSRNLPPNVDQCNLSEVARGLPYFMAGTCAVTEYERAWCRRALSQPTVILASQNLPVIERLWRLTDERGMPVIDWRKALVAQGISVMLFC